MEFRIVFFILISASCQPCDTLDAYLRARCSIGSRRHEPCVKGSYIDDFVRYRLRWIAEAILPRVGDGNIAPCDPPYRFAGADAPKPRGLRGFP